MMCRTSARNKILCIYVCQRLMSIRRPWEGCRSGTLGSSFSGGSMSRHLRFSVRKNTNIFIIIIFTRVTIQGSSILYGFSFLLLSQHFFC